MSDCLDGVSLVPVYQRALLRATWARVWEWAVRELRTHVLSAEQQCLSANSTARTSKTRENPTHRDSNISSRDHDLLASLPLSRLILNYISVHSSHLLYNRVWPICSMFMTGELIHT